ncbi:conjugative relaxase [Sphingomonadaceae bacterium]|nr:conjugative relaxase [Sphingomonadaceae bacterium]
MLSVSSVSSAGGAADYFTADNYYTDHSASQASRWGGEGAKELGLTGKTGKSDFENLLNSQLPDGTVVNSNASRRMGMDLTFSAPKSVSLLALVAGDKRLLEAEMKAVEKTMGWAERHLAEARDYSRTSSGEPVKTRNLVFALFQHDTSRKLDPQAHVHAVIAPVTKAPDGKWKALFNGELWKNNTLIGAAYHAELRNEIEQLGYKTQLTGKHGQFETAGVPKEVLKEFSQRRTEILETVKALGITSHEGRNKVVINTRDKKLDVGDREALTKDWQQRAAARGFNGKQLMEQAIARKAAAISERSPMAHAMAAITETRRIVGDYVRPSDPLTTNGMSRMLLAPREIRTEMAVASAIRIAGQREAAFEIGDVRRAALNLGLQGVTVRQVDHRMAALLRSGQLLPGISDRLDKEVTHFTTPEHLREERQLLRRIDEGRGGSDVIVPAAEAATRLQAYAGDRPLNGEQLGAATLALSTKDTVAVIQGVAGAGKTTLIETMAGVAREEGHKVVGLAFANKMAGMLRDEAGIEAQTVSSFVNQHIRGAIEGEGPAYGRSREELQGSVLVLDEASLVANEAMNNVTAIANRMGVSRLVLIGDRQQLQPIDAGKAFSLVQAHDPAMARMNTSLRQTNEDMQQIATLTRSGAFREAFEVLGPRVEQVAHGSSHIERAAEKYLALSPQNRSATALYASGRSARGQLNALVQNGLKAEGTLSGEGLGLTTLSQVNAAREEMRYAHTYEPGQLLDVSRSIASNGLARGRYEITGRDENSRVLLRGAGGRVISFDPSKISAGEKRGALQLYEKSETTLYKGDDIRWTANDKERDLLNSEHAKVIAINSDCVVVENAKGVSVELLHGDKMLERLGLAYAANMHQAQGMTSDKGIGVLSAHERFLSNQRLTHVMATRVREDIEIVTDDKERLLDTIGRNQGAKYSALEILGEKQIEDGHKKVGAAGRNSSPESLQAVPEKASAGGEGLFEQLRNIPARQSDRDIGPERTIELSH